MTSKFTDLSVDTKMCRLESAVVIAMRKCAKLRRFLDHATNLDACIVPSFLIMLEDEHTKRTEVEASREEDLSRMKTELENLQQRVQNLEHSRQSSTKKKSGKFRDESKSPGSPRFCSTELVKSPFIPR
jgi:uncharacterized protein YlxW (UPF0749 family)